ncbi:MAG: hypothetical protein M3Y87_09700, partial [Myxococcota bacterium]|nr:hypothetical protein [Myxococcota bacterium]
HAQRALAIRDGSGAIEEGEGEVFLVAVRALEAAGRHEEAATLRARGRARLHELAARIVDPTWRASFLERVPEHHELM